MPNCKSCSSGEMPLCDVSNTRFAYKLLFTEYFCDKCKGEQINFALVCNICDAETQYKVAIGDLNITKREFIGFHAYHVYGKIINNRLQEFKDEIKTLLLKNSKHYIEYIYAKMNPPHIFTVEKSSSQVKGLRANGETSKDAWKLAKCNFHVSNIIQILPPIHSTECTANYNAHKLWDKCKFGNAEALKNGDNSFIECTTENIANVIIRSCSAITLTYSMKGISNYYVRTVFKILRANGVVLNCLICDAQYDANISDLVIYEHFKACMDRNKEALAKNVPNIDTLRIYRHEVE